MMIEFPRFLSVSRQGTLDDTLSFILPMPVTKKNASASRSASTGAIVAGVLGAVAIAGLICGLSMGGNSSLSSSKAPAAMTAEAQPKWEAPALDVLSEMREVMSEMGDNTEGSVAQVLDEFAEAVEEHEEEYVEEDWSEFSPGHEDLFDAEDDTAEGEGEDHMPWDQSTIAGPVHLDANLISDGIDASLVSGDHTSLFARLAGNGELFLFAEAESALPVAMIAIDGCAHVMNSAQALRDSCFAIHTMAGRTGAGCVVDAEEAQDWAAALGQSPCD
jgi:hypothetical protein